jgi:fructokinase
MSDNKTHPVVCFGEILWDILPLGAVPGGAPMNVAYHLQKLNKNPALITRIGIDDKGQQLMKIFLDHNVCTDFFQVDNKYETGKVFANPNEFNEVVYDIVKPVAWDFIAWDDSLTDLVKDATYFVYGSLAARNKISKETLFKLLETANNKVLDINLRAPYYNRRIVEQLLRKADFVKMNLAELELITGWFSNYTSIEDRLKSIGDKFRVSNMVVTMGGDGALLLMNGEITKHPGFKVAVADTVGSGDAFLAGLLSQLLDNVDSEATLEFASGLGAFIATQRGACPEYDIKDIKELIQNNMIKI